MLKALMFIFMPQRGWNTVAEDKRGIPFVLFLYLVPLLAITGAIEGLGLAKWGKDQSSVLPTKTFTVPDLKVYVLVQFLMSIIVVFVGAKMVQSICEAFRGRQTYTQTFRLAAYGLSPMFLCRIFDGAPFLPWWLVMTVGLVLSISALYNGVPRIMEPDPPQAFGLYVATAVVLVLVTGMGRVLTAWWLDGRFATVQTWVAKSLSGVL
jgi:hypothetical protein